MVIVDFDSEWARELNNKIGSMMPPQMIDIPEGLRPDFTAILKQISQAHTNLRNHIPLTAAAANGTLEVEGLVNQDNENRQAIEQAMHKIFDPHPGTVAPDSSPESPTPTVDKKPPLPDDEREDLNYFGGSDEIFAKIEEQKRLKQGIPLNELEHTAKQIALYQIHHNLPK